MAERSAQKKLRAKSFRRSNCPLACTLDIIGDKWSMLILRDLFFGKTRYNDFLNSGENIPTNILAARLKHLEEAGLIAGKPYQQRPRRHEYHLTRPGRSLAHIVLILARWGVENIPGTRRIRVNSE